MIVEPWTVIREHRENKEPLNHGRIVWVNEDLGKYWWIPFPEKDEHTHTRNFIKAIRQDDISNLKDRLEKDISLVNFNAPKSWSLTERELNAEANEDKHTRVSYRSRRKMQNWKKRRDEVWDEIKVLFESNNFKDIIELDMLTDWAADRARNSGHPRPNTVKAKLTRAARMYILSGLNKNSLMPDWDGERQLGKPKVSSKPTGRKYVDGTPAYVISDADRSKLQRGWKKYKKAHRSVYTAFQLTNAEYYCLAVRPIGISEPNDVDLLPPEQRPSLAQFCRHGPSDDPATSASRINLGAHRWERDHRPLRGSARDGLVAAGQMAWIDSTSDDQTLASTASRLKMLSSPWNTKVMEGYTGYILGIHSGFERGSTLAGLMAIAHAASPKEEYCKRYNRELKPGEWISFCPRRVRGDNGDIKSEAGIRELGNAEMTAEFVCSYASDYKGPVESGHRSIAADAGHQMAGSTQGRRWERGDEKREDAFCLTHSEYVPHLIDAILRHNNETRVEKLLTLEMRADNVLPFRGDILKWMVKKGYVVSEPTNLNDLKGRCLPQLAAVIHKNGVRVFDPRTDKIRLIPKLLYWSEWLHSSGLTTKARNKTLPCYIHIDPSNLSKVLLRMDGLQELDLQTNDPLMTEITLFDWLMIADDDRISKHLDRADSHRSDANHSVQIERTNKGGREAKNQEVINVKGRIPSKSMQRKGKRDATKQEIVIANAQKLGFPTDVAVRLAAASSSTEFAGGNWTSCDDDEEVWMNAVRTQPTKKSDDY